MKIPAANIGEALRMASPRARDAVKLYLQVDRGLISHNEFLSQLFMHLNSENIPEVAELLEDRINEFKGLLAEPNFARTWNAWSAGVAWGAKGPEETVEQFDERKNSEVKAAYERHVQGVEALRAYYRATDPGFPESALAERIARALDEMEHGSIAHGVASELSDLLRQIDPIPPTVIPALIKKLRYDERPADAARGVLRNLGTPALESLIAMLDTEDLTLRGHVAFAIGTFGEAAKQALPALEKLLQETDKHVRVHAAMAIWRIDGRTREMARIVMEGFQSYAELAWKAADCLREMGPEAAEVVPELTEILRGHQDPWWRWQAAVALGGMGLEAVPAIPSLIEAMKASDNDLSQSAYYALGELRALAKLGDLILQEFDGGPKP